MIFVIHSIRKDEGEAASVPEVQNPERGTGPGQDSADDDIGIEDNPRTPRGRHGSRCELALQGGRLRG